MAFTSVGSLGTAAEGASADSTLTLTTSAQLDAGNLGILTVVSDNAGASGNTNHHTSVTDGDGNTYTKLYEYTYSPGSAGADGVTVSMWWVRPGSNLASSSTLTINQSANTAEKCASFWEFTAGAGVQVAGTPQTSGGNQSHPASLSLSSLTSKEYLFVRVVGKEVNSTTALTATTNYTTIDGTRSRNNSAAVLVRGEFRILTGTGDTSSPTMNVICDTGSIYIAIEEAGGAYTLTAGQGAFSLTGQAAGLVAARVLAMGQAAFTLSGQTAGLLFGHLLGAGLGSFSLSGQDVTLTYTPLGGYTLAAGLGTFALTGQAAGLAAARVLGAGQGSFVLSGQAANLLFGRLLGAGLGSFSLSGQAAGVLFGRYLGAGPGSFILTGQAGGLAAARLLALAVGSFVLTGRDAALTFAGAVVFTGIEGLTGQGSFGTTMRGSDVAGTMDEDVEDLHL